MKKFKANKRLLCVILSIVLVMGVVPVYAQEGSGGDPSQLNLDASSTGGANSNAGSALTTESATPAPKAETQETPGQPSPPNSKPEITKSPAAPTLYKIKLASMKGGKVSAGVKEAAEGTKIKLTVKPDEGYQLVANTLKYNGNPISGSSFQMPGKPVTITAEFELIPPADESIPAADIAGESADPSENEAAEEDAAASLAATPGEAVAIANELVPIPPASYSISVASMEGGSVTPSVDEAAEGATVSLTVTPDSGYQLKPSTLNTTAKTSLATAFQCRARQL